METRAVAPSEAGEDPELLAAVAAGDREALRALYDRHAAMVVLRLSRRCADGGVVDEVLQDTFVSVWRGAAGYRGEGEVGAWIWGIAVRRLLDHLRRQGRRPSILERVGTVMSAEEHVLVGVEHGRLGPAIDGLAPELRAVVEATVLDGLTNREAAELLGVPVGTVKSRMRRARTSLREALT